MKDRNLINELKYYSIILSQLKLGSEEFKFIIEQMKNILSVYDYTEDKCEEPRVGKWDLTPSEVPWEYYSAKSLDDTISSDEFNAASFPVENEVEDQIFFPPDDGLEFLRTSDL